MEQKMCTWMGLKIIKSPCRNNTAAGDEQYAENSKPKSENR